MPENRMKEIKGNLKRDMQDLLGESANLVANLFKEGFCTMRGIANKWKLLAQDIGNAVDTFMTTPPIMRERPVPTLNPEGQPIVTIIESEHEDFPVGKQMTLSEAAEQLQKLHAENGNSPPKSAKVIIDYIMDGQADRYCLPLQVGTDKPLLEQMQVHVSSLNHSEKVEKAFDRVSPEFKKLLKEKFAPQIQEDVKSLSGKILAYFTQHLTIARLEKNFAAQASVMPEKQQQNFRQSMKSYVAQLRHATNQNEVKPTQQHAEQALTTKDKKTRTSVKAKLGRASEKKSTQTPPKARTAPAR